MEKQAAENKKQFEKVMGAEISQRYKLYHNLLEMFGKINRYTVHDFVRFLVVKSLDGIYELYEFYHCRKMHEASTIEKLASVNEKLQIATSSLQQSIGGITQVMNSQNEKVHRN